MAQFEIGVDARCTDGVCGTVIRVVVDPIARRVTHLVVEPRHRQGMGRLVPLALVEGASPDGVRLRCTSAAFEDLPAAEDADFLTGSDGLGGYGSGQTLLWPYYTAGVGMGNVGMGGMGVGGTDLGYGLPPLITDHLPEGEIGIRRGQHVEATDGTIGRVQGLVVAPDDHRVTHILLQEGHLFGRHDVAVPISAVASLADGIRLRLSQDEVQALPDVDAQPPTDVQLVQP